MIFMAIGFDFLKGNFVFFVKIFVCIVVKFYNSESPIIAQEIESGILIPRIKIDWKHSILFSLLNIAVMRKQRRIKLLIMPANIRYR